LDGLAVGPHSVVAERRIEHVHLLPYLGGLGTVRDAFAENRNHHLVGGVRAGHFIGLPEQGFMRFWPREESHVFPEQREAPPPPDAAAMSCIPVRS
jgi:hypothetical protein